MFLKGEFSNRLVQVSLFAGIVYYITAYPVVFESARKYFPVKFKKTHHLLIFHTFVFAVLMYVLTYFVFDPLVKVVEGSKFAVSDSDCQKLRGRFGGSAMRSMGCYTKSGDSTSWFYDQKYDGAKQAAARADGTLKNIQQ